MGKRELDLAAARANVQLELSCKPFMLDQTLPAKGVDKLYHYTKKFGPQAETMLKDPNGHLNQRGRAIGCDFKYHEGSKVFNSRNCHLLVTWADECHGQAATAKLYDVFLEMYLNRGSNLGLHEEMLAGIEEAGLPVDEAKLVLAGKHDKSEELEERLDEELLDSHRKTSGVPHFFFEDGTNFSGAQPGEVLDKVIAKVLAKSSA